MRKKYKWVFIYWMPYDNNLSVFKQRIIEMIVQGCRSKDVCVIIFSDTRGQGFIEKTIISGGEIFMSVALNANNSSDPNVLNICLMSVYKVIESQHWGVVFLGHGGTIDKISPDESIDGNNVVAEHGWMNILDIKNILFEFIEIIDKKLDFLFLQNCCKGTIEANYNFKDVTEYIISSQNLLGAPNYYYISTLNYISNNLDINGRDVVEIIIGSDRADMYFSYTITDCKHVGSIASKVNPLINKALSYELPSNLEFITTVYAGENLVDLDHFFKQILNSRFATEDEYWNFKMFLDYKVIHYLKVNPVKQKTAECGLSMFFPADINQIYTYKNLDFYKETNMISLFEKIVRNR